jgi:hypothetical protein
MVNKEISLKFMNALMQESADPELASLIDQLQPPKSTILEIRQEEESEGFLDEMPIIRLSLKGEN